MKPKKKPRPMPASWIVVIRSNLDDVICGSYPTYQQARGRMYRVRKNPDAELNKNNMKTWDTSGIICLSIFRVQGDKVELWGGEDFEDEKEAA